MGGMIYGGHASEGGAAPYKSEREARHAPLKKEIQTKLIAVPKCLQLGPAQFTTAQLWPCFAAFADSSLIFSIFVLRLDTASCRQRISFHLRWRGDSSHFRPLHGHQTSDTRPADDGVDDLGLFRAGFRNGVWNWIIVRLDHGLAKIKLRV